MFIKARKVLDSELNIVRIIQKLRLSSTLISNISHVSKLKRQTDMLELQSNADSSQTDGDPMDQYSKNKGSMTLSESIFDLERNKERPSTVQN